MNDITVPSPSGILDTHEDDMSRVVRKALQNIEYILDMDIPQGRHEDMARYLSIKKDAATAIISAGLKADENRFRKENKDIVERLFEKIKINDKIIEGRTSEKRR